MADVIGWLAAILSMISGLPQLIRLIRTRDTNGLSLVTWQLQATTVWAWFSHGVIYDQPNQIISTSFLGLTMLLIVIAIIVQRRLNPVRVLWPMLAGLLVLIVIDLLLGRTAYGLLVIIPQIYSLWAQLAELRRARYVSGFSPLYSVIGVITQLLYVWWGLLIADQAILISSSTNAALHAAILWIWWRRRAGEPPMDTPVSLGLPNEPQQS